MGGSSRKVLVIGSLNADLIAVAPRLPSIGETVIGATFHVAPGGKGANQAVAAARMGARVEMIGRVGNDSFGALLQDELRRAGVGIDHVCVDANAATGTGHIVLDAKGQNMIVVASGANERLVAADLERATTSWADAGLVVLQLEVPLSTVAAAVRMAAARRIPVLLNCAPAHPLPADLLASAAWLVVNEVEAAQLTGEPVCNHRDAMLAARQLGTASQRVVVTLGEAGAVLFSRDGACHVEAPRIDAVDTTAAGDAFVGTLAAALAAGVDDAGAVRRAVIAGSLACTKLGAIPSLPTAADVDSFRSQLPTPDSR